MALSVLAGQVGAQETRSGDTALLRDTKHDYERRAMSPASGYRAWIGGGVGASGHAALAAAWEAWVSRGALGVGYQRSATDDFSGAQRSAHGFLVGMNMPYRRVLGRGAAGIASARRCLWQGEQSGRETCTSESRPELAVAADVLLSPYFAIHTSYFSIPGGSVGHSAFILGVTLGRVGAWTRKTR